MLTVSARSDTDNPEYLSPEAHHLAVDCTVTEGNGSAEAPFLHRVKIRNDGSASWSGVIRLALRFEAEAPRFFMPGFLYGTNRGEAPLQTGSKAPRLRKGNPDFPASSWWMTRSDRLSHPAVFAFTGERITGLCASPYFVRADGRITAWAPGVSGDWLQYAGFGCDLDRREISYTLGYENVPWFFLNSRHYSPRAPLAGNRFSLAPGEEVCFTAAEFSYPAACETGLNAALRKVYSLYHELPRRCQSPESAVRTIAEAVGSAAWLPRYRAYAGFVFDKPDSREVRLLPSISWTNGLAAAVPMLEASLRLHREDLRNQALQCISHIVQTSINPRNGLPFTAEIEGTWCNRGWWYDAQPVPGHAAYLVGQAVYLILKAYMFEEQLSGEKHGDWLEYARKVLFVTEQSRNGDGEYPYIFSEETGAGLCYDSLSGAWCLAAAALYCALSGETGRLVDLMDSERYYYRAFVSRMECYGGPLDIDKQTDSEGILAYIRAVRWLHEITREPELLDHMRDALEYEFTFKFCYNSPIKVPPLSRVGWSSCGGSITSVCNPHIHPMSSSVIDELLYYTEQTGDEYIRSRLEDTVLWSCQVSNTRDREYDYGKTGWMSERFCHSEGLLTETYPDGSPASTWFALMPWACGCILEGLAGDWWDLDK